MAWLVSAAPPDRRGELIGSALAAAIVGVLFGPVLGGAATVVGPEVVFSGVSVVAAGLAVWAWTTPGVPPEPSPGVPRAAARAAPARRAGRLLAVHAAGRVRGRLEVLVPLRLDDLGASGAAIGAIFLVAAAVEARAQPRWRAACRTGAAGSRRSASGWPGRR